MGLTKEMEVLVKANGIAAVQAQIRNLSEESKKAGTATTGLADRFSAGGAKASVFAGAVKAAFTGVAGLAVINFGKESVAAFEDSEEAQIRLEDAFSRFAPLANTNIEALRALNIELMNKTGIDDDAIASGQELLAGFGVTGKQLQALTPLMTDLSVKMGVDVGTAATTLGRALLGNGRQLKKLGVDFENTGTKSGNLQQIMDKLGPVVDGVGERMGDTAAGKAKRFKQQMSEIQELIGSKVLPVINVLTGFVLGLAQGFLTLPGPVQLMIVTVAAAIAIMLNWEKITKAVKAAQLALNTALKGNPLVLVISLVAALVTALVYAYTHSEKFRTAINNAFRTIAPVVGTVIGYIIGCISSMVKAWTWGIDAILTVLSHIPKIGDVFEAAKKKVDSASKGITDKLDSIAVGAKKMVVDYAANLSDKLPTATKDGSDSAIAQAKKFAANLGSTGAIAGDKLASGIKSKTGKVKAATKAVVDEAAKMLQQFVSDIDGIMAATSAKSALAKAERDLNALYREQAGLGDAIAQAQLRVNAAKTDGLTITAEEQVAIEDAASSLDDARRAMADYAALPEKIAAAEAALAAVQADSEASTSDLHSAERDLADLRKEQAAGAPYSPAKLQVLEDRLSQAKADAVAPTDDLKAAEQALAELRAREVQIQQDIAAANQEVIDKTLAVAQAQAAADKAQQDLAKNGETLLAYFTNLAVKAGLSADQIARVTAALNAQSGAVAALGGSGSSVASSSLQQGLDAGLSMADALSGARYAGQGAAQYAAANPTVQVTVQGSVIAQNDLTDALRAALLTAQYYGKDVFR